MFYTFHTPHFPHSTFSTEPSVEIVRPGPVNQVLYISLSVSFRRSSLTLMNLLASRKFVTKQLSQPSNMSAFCSKVKIAFYFILICYHIVDLILDWWTFGVLLQDHKFSGVSVSKCEECTIKFLIGLSCSTGTLFSIALVVAYSYYIRHHLHRLKNASYSPVNQSDEDVSLPPHQKCDKKFVNLEFWFSVLELFFKDDIQSGILFWVYHRSQSSAISNPAGRMWIAFSVCSIVANLKLCVCFVTKLFGCGAGEELCPENLCKAKPLCAIGSIFSVIFFILTVIVFHEEMK